MSQNVEPAQNIPPKTLNEDLTRAESQNLTQGGYTRSTEEEIVKNSPFIGGPTTTTTTNDTRSGYVTSVDPNVHLGTNLGPTNSGTNLGTDTRTANFGTNPGTGLGTNFGSTNLGTTNLGPTSYGTTNFGTDLGTTNYGTTNFGTTNLGPTSYGTTTFGTNPGTNLGTTGLGTNYIGTQGLIQPGTFTTGEFISGPTQGFIQPSFGQNITTTGFQPGIVTGTGVGTGLGLAGTNSGLVTTEGEGITQLGAAPRGTFVFRPVEGRFVKNSDRIGLMDPYCKIKIGFHSGKTAVAKSEGTHPIWNDVITIEKKHNEKFAKLKVKDYDKMSLNDKVGEVKIPLGEIASKGRVNQWFPIYKKDQMTGEILLDISFQPKAVALGTTTGTTVGPTIGTTTGTTVV